jgi:Transposase DDE domain group 1
MENRIKECQLDLYADRTSTATMRANQLRLWFASMAYVLICALRRIGLHDTDFAKATCGTIRLKLLKIGAIVRISVRRIKIAMASACPVAQDWALARRLGTRLASMTQKAATRHHTQAHRGQLFAAPRSPAAPQMSQPLSRLQTPRQAVPSKMQITLLSNPLDHEG